MIISYFFGWEKSLNQTINQYELGSIVFTSVNEENQVDIELANRHINNRRNSEQTNDANVFTEISLTHLKEFDEPLKLIEQLEQQASLTPQSYPIFDLIENLIFYLAIRIRRQSSRWKTSWSNSNYQCYTWSHYQAQRFSYKVMFLLSSSFLYSILKQQKKMLLSSIRMVYESHINRNSVVNTDVLFLRQHTNIESSNDT